MQLTPPGSGCSIAIGTVIVDTPPGTARLQMVVADADGARADFAGRGLDVGDVEDLEWGRFTGFADPDGDTWAIQPLPVRA